MFSETAQAMAPCSVRVVMIAWIDAARPNECANSTMIATAIRFLLQRLRPGVTVATSDSGGSAATASFYRKDARSVWPSRFGGGEVVDDREADDSRVYTINALQLVAMVDEAICHNRDVELAAAHVVDPELGSAADKARMSG